VTTGAVRWRARTETPAYGLVVDRGIAVVGGVEEGYASSYAFRTGTGRRLWDLPDWVPAGSVAAGGTLLLTTRTGDAARAVDLTTGRTRWSTRRGWAVQAADPSGGLFLVTGRATNPAQEGTTLIAVRADSGRVVWSRTGLGGPVAADNRRVYAASIDGGTMVVADLGTGQTRWQRRFGAFRAPTLAGGVLWLAFPDRRVRALDPRTGADYAVARAVATLRPADRPVVADGRLYLTDGTTLRAFAITAPRR
jgi:outer membrane protein assembly factor BamB